MTMSIQQGSKGPNVKKLQEDLIARGLLAKGFNTGFYGPLTAAALQKYNKSAGMHPDNTVVGASDYLDSHPNLMGTPAGKYLQNLKMTNPELYNTIANAAKNGQNFTPEMFAEADTTAKDALNPYYTQDAQNSKGALQNYLDTTTNAYGIDTNSLQNSATNDFNTLNDTEGKNGTWASGARESRMKSLESTYNDKFNSLYNTNRGNIAEKLQGQEYNYGTAATPTVNIGQTKANFSSAMPNFSSTSSSVYNPFNFSGRKPAEQSANITDFTNKGVSGMFNPFSVKTNN